MFIGWFMTLSRVMLSSICNKEKLLTMILNMFESKLKDNPEKWDLGELDNLLDII